MNINALEIEKFGVIELNTEELENTDGGVAPLIPILIVVVGAIVVGAVVGYAIYRLIDWATS